jgi:pyrroline-5-carboxylate reductase
MSFCSLKALRVPVSRQACRSHWPRGSRARRSLLHRSDLDPSKLRENVTSPGGTTAAALKVLMARGGLDPLMKKAVAAATKRSRQLAG